MFKLSINKLYILYAIIRENWLITVHFLPGWGHRVHLSVQEQRALSLLELALADGHGFATHLRLRYCPDQGQALEG